MVATLGPFPGTVSSSCWLAIITVAWHDVRDGPTAVSSSRIVLSLLGLWWDAWRRRGTRFRWRLTSCGAEAWDERRGAHGLVGGNHVTMS